MVTKVYKGQAVNVGELVSGGRNELVQCDARGSEAPPIPGGFVRTM